MTYEASILLRKVAVPGSNVKATISETAKHFGWKFNRTRDLYYARARRIDAAEMDALRAAAAVRKAEFETLASAMQSVDPTKNSADIALLLRAARSLGGDRLS